MKLREQIGITQKDVAERLDVTDQSVSNWEIGKHEPKLTVNQWINYYRLLNCTPDDLRDAIATARRDYEQKKIKSGKKQTAI